MRVIGFPLCWAPAWPQRESFTQHVFIESLLCAQPPGSVPLESPGYSLGSSCPVTGTILRIQWWWQDNLKLLRSILQSLRGRAGFSVMIHLLVPRGWSFLSARGITQPGFHWPAYVVKRPLSHFNSWNYALGIFITWGSAQQLTLKRLRAKFLGTNSV